jgi:hypothetical protein
MDKEQKDLDVFQAAGVAAATLALQTGLIAALLDKNLLTREDIASITGVADAALSQVSTLEPEARAIAEILLRGAAKSMTAKLTKN